jgi:hypothetical protein
MDEFFVMGEEGVAGILRKIETADYPISLGSLGR